MTTSMDNAVRGGGPKQRKWYRFGDGDDEREGMRPF